MRKDDDISDKYRQGMGQWAGVLGWRYQDHQDYRSIVIFKEG